MFFFYKVARFPPETTSSKVLNLSTLTKSLWRSPTDPPRKYTGRRKKEEGEGRVVADESCLAEGRKEREKEREKNVGKGEKRDKSVELCDLIFIFVTRKAVREFSPFSMTS